MDNFLESHQEGTLDSEGVFTIDPAKARQKLQAFQLPGPAYCLLKFVQVAVALGAKRVTFLWTSEIVSVGLYGLHSLPELKDWPDRLENPLGFEGRAESHLAVGFVASFEMFESLEWRQQGRTLKITDTDIVCLANEVRNLQTVQLELRVRAGSKIDWDWVVARCCYAPIPIHFDGVDFRPPDPLPAPLLLDTYLAPSDPPAMSIPFGLKGSIGQGESDDVWVQKGSRFIFFTKPPSAYLTVTYPAQSFTSERVMCGGRISVGLPKTKKSVYLPVQDGVTLEPIEFNSRIAVHAVIPNPPFEWDVSGFRAREDEAYSAYWLEFQRHLESLYHKLDDNLKHLSFNLRRYPRFHDLVGKRILDWIVWETAEPVLVPSSSRHQSGQAYKVLRSFSSFGAYTLTCWDGTMPASGEIERLESEATSFREFAHPNIVPILEMGVKDQTYFLLERYLDAPRMIAELPKDGFELKRAHRLFLSICRTLRAAQNQGVVLPLEVLSGYFVAGNELVMRYSYSPTQPGFKQAIKIDAQLPPFQLLSPEAITSKTTSPLSALFSLGALGYMLFTGRGPFGIENNPEILTRILNVSPQDPKELREDIPVATAQLLMHCLEKNPEDRPQSVDEILEVLASG